MGSRSARPPAAQPFRPTRSTVRSRATNAEIRSDPIALSDTDDHHGPQSQATGADDAPDPCSHGKRIFPLDDELDEIRPDPPRPAVSPRVTRNKSRRRPHNPHQKRTTHQLPFDSAAAKPAAAFAVPDSTEVTPVIRRGRLKRRSGQSLAQDDQLEALLANVTSEHDRDQILAAWKTDAGRRKLLRLAQSGSNDSNSDWKARRPRPRGGQRKLRYTEVESDDDGNAHRDPFLDEDTPLEAGTPLPSGIKTRRGRAREQRRAAKESVPLPKSDSLQNRLRNRNSLLAPANGRVTRQSARINGVQIQKQRRRTNGKRNGRARSRRRGSGIIDDVEEDLDEVVTDEDEMDVLDNADQEEAEDIDDGEDDEEADVDLADDESEEDDEEQSDEEFYYTESRSKKKRKAAKKSVRRKRTRPTDAFESKEHVLSLQEQKQRLDFLVNQSDEIARDLHKAMAAAAATPKNGLSGGAKSPSQRGVSIKTGDDAGADKTEVKPSQDADGEANADGSSARSEEKFAPPTGKGMELQPHQTDGVKWLLTLDAQGLNAILADEMGLGKTIQTVAFLASLLLSGSRGPHLVVAPKNVCAHWAAEVKAWYPGQITVVTHLGSAEERFEELRTVLEEDNFDILVTSFEVALRDLFTRRRYDGALAPYASVLRAFRKVEFEYLIVDEAHRLKNDMSKLGLGIRQYDRAQRRLLLTGTPLSNNLKELWSLMNVLNPRIFSSKATFEAWFAAPFDAGKGSKAVLTHAEQSVIVDRLHSILRPFFRRRERADICPTFTSADEVVIRCPMSQMQKALMLHFQRRASASEAGINNIIMAMRVVSSHPFIVSNVLFDAADEQADLHLVSSCGKFAFLHFSLPRLIAGGHRILIFSQFRGALDFLEDLLEMLGIQYGRLDGMTTSGDRISTLSEFNAEGSPLQVFLLTTRAGGVGLNLQTADTVILFDSDWNPSADLQAVSRIQRIGQKKTVHIMRLVTEKSVDDVIMERARQKLRTQAVAVGAGKFNTSSGAALDQKCRQKDLEQLLQKLDISNFMPVEDSEEKTPQSPAQGSPESVSPNRERRNTQALYVKEWTRQLLRSGEDSLPDVEKPSIWIDTPDKSGSLNIPGWLRKDTDLVAAGKALNCQTREDGESTYEREMQSNARVGAFSKKDRAMRARRNVAVEMDWDLGSDHENVISEDDPSLSLDDCSDMSTDEEFVPGSAPNVLPETRDVSQRSLPQQTDPGQSPLPLLPKKGRKKSKVSQQNSLLTFVPIASKPFNSSPTVAQTLVRRGTDEELVRRQLGPTPLPSIQPSPPHLATQPNPPKQLHSPGMSSTWPRAPTGTGPGVFPKGGQSAVLGDFQSLARRQAQYQAMQSPSVQRALLASNVLSGLGTTERVSGASQGLPSAAGMSGPSTLPSFGSPRLPPIQSFEPIRRLTQPLPVALQPAAQSPQPIAVRSAAQVGPPLAPRPVARTSTAGSSPSNASRGQSTIDLTGTSSSTPKVHRLGTIDLTGTSDSGPDIENFVNDVSSEHVQATHFRALVDRLREVTKVEDIDFLVDALLACGGSIDGAADYIYSHIM